MWRRLSRVWFVTGTVLAGCTGSLAGEGATTADDLGATVDDAGFDAGTAPARDVPAAPIDRGVVRDVPPAPVDTGVRPPVDAGVSMACAGGPLAAPRAGCRPSVPPTTGDPRQDCVNRINQFRRECQCLPPLQRWADGESCADRDAMIDQESMTAHNGFRMRVCATGSGQNECPGWLGWGSVTSTLSGCLQQMWDEGPGDFYGPPAHGHYLNMSSRTFTRVACGFFTSGSATTAVQNFQ